MSAKLRSIFTANKDMKAVSKMLTQEFTLSKTEVPNVMTLTMKNGETQSVTIIDNRFAVISYAKPKGAKASTIFLNKSTPITSMKASKVVVVDLEERTVENGDSFVGFSLKNGGNVPVDFLLGSSLELVAVRNYINHTQLYVATLDNKVLVADNIKAVRAFINAEVKVVSDAFAPREMEAFEADMTTALEGSVATA
jgi:hypothetical protein